MLFQARHKVRLRPDMLLRDQKSLCGIRTHENVRIPEESEKATCKSYSSQYGLM